MSSMWLLHPWSKNMCPYPPLFFDVGDILGLSQTSWCTFPPRMSSLCNLDVWNFHLKSRTWVKRSLLPFSPRLVLGKYFRSWVPWIIFPFENFFPAKKYTHCYNLNQNKKQQNCHNLMMKRWYHVRWHVLWCLKRMYTKWKGYHLPFFPDTRRNMRVYWRVLGCFVELKKSFLQYLDLFLHDMHRLDTSWVVLSNIFF